MSNPYLTDLFNGVLTILHKDGGRRPVAVVQAEHVTRVIPFDELPAEPGCLSYREFHQLYRSFSRATPFRPFSVELIDGRRFAVENKDQMSVNGRFASARDGAKGPCVVFPIAIASAVTILEPAEVV